MCAALGAAFFIGVVFGRVRGENFFTSWWWGAVVREVLRPATNAVLRMTELLEA